MIACCVGNHTYLHCVKKLTKLFVYTIIILLFSNIVFGQKYMIRGKDTLPFKADRVITNDTMHRGKTIIITSDTTFVDPCYVFEKIKGEIVNRTDSNCLQQGLWIFAGSNGNYSTSIYVDGKDGGKWKEYNNHGRLLKELEEVTLGKEYFIVKEIDYAKGYPVTVVNVPLFGFYINHFFIILPLLVSLMVVRILINYTIYNIENNTNYPSFGNRFKVSLNEPGELRHRLVSVFTLWFFRYKTENRTRIIVSNILSVFCFGSIIILMFGPLFCR
ncbi:hypothetical protein BH09BAC6_BH09BAC6_27190 [soil metagenome]